MKRGVLFRSRYPFSPLPSARASFLGVVLLVVLSSLVGMAGDAARLSVKTAVDRNFRGVYDILVRPADAALRPELTYGLVEQNLLGTAGSGGISVADWRRIQSLPYVEVAAPIAAVGYLSSVGGTPTVEVPYPMQPALYRIEISVTTSDGVRTLRVARESGLAFVRPPDSAHAPELASTFIDFGGDNSPRGYADFTMVRFPVFSGLVAAVDPRSEDQLLGRNVFAAMSVLPDASLLNTTQFDLRLVPSTFAQNRALIDIRSRSTSGALGDAQRRPAAPVVPLVLNSSGAPAVTITWKVWRLQATRPAPRGAAEGQDPESFFKAIYDPSAPANLVIDQTAAEAHFGLPLTPAELLLPPSGPPQLGGGLRDPGSFFPRLAQRPSYTVSVGPPALGNVPTFGVQPLGFEPPSPPTDPNAYRSYDGSGLPVFFEEPAAEQTYRRLVTERSASVPTQNAPPGSLDLPYYLAPLGSFDLDRLRLPINPVNYAPLGAYDPVDAALVAGQDGVSLPSPVNLRPTFNAAGFLVVPPAGFTNIGGAVLLKGPRPIDAIRVRVSGVTGFDADSRSRLAAVAAAIRRLGLRADVVAGSSPRRVSVDVPNYLGSPDDPKDLGWVEQHWTSLGAASQVSTGLTRLTWEVLALALASALLFSFAIQHLSIQVRTQSIGLLRAVGWRRRDVRRVVMASSFRVAGLVAAIGLLVGRLWKVLYHHPGNLWWAPAALALAWLAATPGAVRRAGRVAPLQGAVSGDIRRPNRLPSVRSPRGYGFRQVAVRPRRAAIQMLTLGLGASALALAGLFVATARGRAGPTALASLTAGSVRPLHVAMAASAGVLLLVAAVSERSVDAAERRSEWAILRAVGWRSSSVSSAGRWENLGLGLIAAIPVIPIVIIGALLIGVSPLAAAGTAAITVPGVMVLTVLAGAVALRPKES